MAITTFIPKLWSARLLMHLDKNMVYGNLVNRDYEGEIRQYGDTVHINQIGDITIKNYTKGSDIDAPEDLTTTDQSLVIDQAKYFNFALDDIDKAQARAELMDEAMARASYGLSDESDKFIAGLMATAAGISIGSTASPIALTKDNVYEQLVLMKTKLDKANVPTAGRWVVVPPEMEGLMLMDNRFVAAGTPATDTRLAEGTVYKAAGFMIYVSNNVPSTDSKYSIIASTNMSTTFAQQIVETEGYRPEKGFKDAMKGLNVYGGKVTVGGAICKLIATFA